MADVKEDALSKVVEAGYIIVVGLFVVLMVKSVLGGDLIALAALL